MVKDITELDTDEPIDLEERIEHLDIGPLATEDKLTLQQETPEFTVSDEQIENDKNRADQWLVYNKGLEQTGFSPADRLTPDNIDSLSRKWSIEPESAGLQVNPVVVPSDPPVLYYTTANTKVVAVNARTGEEFWSFQYGYPEDPEYYFAPRSRGVTVWGDKVFAGAGNMRLFALDQRTGEKVWDTDFLTQEQYDEMQYTWKGYGITQAPVAYGGKVFAGQSGGDGSPEGWTYARAFDAESGDEVWTSPKMTPEDEWVDETWRFGNGSPWMSCSIDTESETAFWCTGNPGPMLNGIVRPGPNNYTAGMVALDINNGELKWAHQLVTGDIWDYDGQFSPMIFNMEVDGEKRRVVEADHKTGWSSVIDVETGQLLERSRPFAKQDGHFLKWLPMGEENGENVFPQTGGGTAWAPDSWSPQTGMRYVGACDAGYKEWMEEWEFDASDGLYEESPIGGGTAEPEGLGEEFTHSSNVRAVDLDTGEIAWSYEFTEGVVDTWPGGRIEAGGTTATAGNLVFGSSPAGYLVALNAETGELLWKDDSGAARINTSATVWDDPDQNTQYVSIAANDKIITYTGGGA